MKAPRGGGARRVKDPEVSAEQLFDKLTIQVKHFTIAASAFDLHGYNAMEAMQSMASPFTKSSAS